MSVKLRKYAISSEVRFTASISLVSRLRSWFILTYIQYSSLLINDAEEKHLVKIDIVSFLRVHVFSCPYRCLQATKRNIKGYFYSKQSLKISIIFEAVLVHTENVYIKLMQPLNG